MALAQSTARTQQTYMAQQGMGRGGPSGLADVLEVLLDKGLVIDAFVRVSLVGIELLTVDARIVIASVDTYLRFAEAVNRLDLNAVNQSKSLADLAGGGSKALSGRSQRVEGRPDEPEGEHDGADRSQSAAEEQPDSGEPERGSDAEPEPSEGGDDDKGILTRIKERGQVF